jgi:SAM-dependent methyltransferase
MASTHKTFDVAIWCAPADLPSARDCARHLRRLNLRVAVRHNGAAVTRRNVTPQSDRSPARVDLALVGGRSAPAWLDGPPLLDLPSPDVVCLAGDVTPADARQIARAVRTRTLDMRLADRHRWRTLGAHLVDAGRGAETAIDPRFGLAPAQLQHATIESYDHIAAQFADRWFDHPPERELDLFLQQLRPRSRVLDAGCGPGHHARLISLAWHDVVAVDLSDGMLRQARRRVPSIRSMKMNLAALTFAAGTFDAIWCAAAILHIPREHLAAVLRGFRRVLAPGGLLGLNFQVGRDSELVQRGRDHRFFEYYADAAPIAACVERAGFTIDAEVYGETTRNTHDLDLTLKWSTLYARAGLYLSAGISRTPRSPFRIARQRSSSVSLHARK